MASWDEKNGFEPPKAFETVCKPCKVLACRNEPWKNGSGYVVSDHPVSSRWDGLKEKKKIERIRGRDLDVMA